MKAPLSRAWQARLMATGAEYSFNKLHSYVPPSWTKPALSKYAPAAFVKLACRPTPIHSLNIPGVPNEYQVSVKRDDLTGSTLSGNKTRKLEFLLADALLKGCDSVVTCGGIQSNHARTTAMAARQLGLHPHLVLRWYGSDMDPDAVDCSGNVLLNRLAGAKILLVPPLSYEGSIVDGKQTPGLKHKMQEYMEKLRSEGSFPYLIPVGGSNSVGAWGYIEAFKELMEQNVLENFDDIVMAVGSGGSTCGLVIGNYLTGSNIRIHAVCVCDNADYFYEHIDKQLEEFGLKDPRGNALHSRDLVDIIEGYKGRGYGLSTDEELAQLLEISTQTGIPLDPVYTFKGVRGLIAELQKKPGRFKGKRILYIHTGGIFGLYDGRMDKPLKETPLTNQVSVI